MEERIVTMKTKADIKHFVKISKEGHQEDDQAPPKENVEKEIAERLYMRCPGCRAKKECRAALKVGHWWRVEAL